MKKSYRGGFVSIALLIGVLAACGETSTDDSQTHWLDECQSSAECGSALSCECGRCVATCTAGAACSVPGGGSARCFEPGSAAVQALCGAATTPPPICLAECGDCPAGQECSGGACVPIGNGAGGSGGNGGSGGSGGSSAGSGGSGGGDATCYGPHQALDNPISPDQPGCPCAAGESVCALWPQGWAALICQDGRWLSVEDGPCGPEPLAQCSEDQTCPAGESCSVGGVFGGRRCRPLAAEATSCTNPDHPQNECCTTAECAEGACYETVFAPTGPCGGGGFDQVNRCLADECSSDAECLQNEICVDGVKPDALKACVAVSCKTSTDCTAEPGGQCSWIGGGCCGGIGDGFNNRVPILACVYPSDWCRADSDCAAPTPYCVVDGGRAHCAAECHQPL